MISNIDQRIFKFQAGGSVWTDLTIPLNDNMNSQTVMIALQPTDFLYISSFLPFNHKYFRVVAPSANGVFPKIEICSSSSEWSPVVDVIDYTANMARSGVIQWTVDYDKSWGRVSKNKFDIQAMAGAPLVYDQYWMRISWPGGAVSFELDYVGQLFSGDADLYAQYPILRNSTIQSGWAAGKTDWIDQHILAANYITKELIQRNIILNNAQVLDIATMRSPAVHKTANIIYSGLGAKNYEKEILLSSGLFDQAMRMDKFQIDSNMNARKDIRDMTVTSSRATR